MNKTASLLILASGHLHKIAQETSMQNDLTPTQRATGVTGALASAATVPLAVIEGGAAAMAPGATAGAVLTPFALAAAPVAAVGAGFYGNHLIRQHANNKLQNTYRAAARPVPVSMQLQMNKQRAAAGRPTVRYPQYYTPEGQPVYGGFNGTGATGSW